MGVRLGETVMQSDVIRLNSRLKSLIKEEQREGETPADTLERIINAKEGVPTYRAIDRVEVDYQITRLNNKMSHLEQLLLSTNNKLEFLIVVNKPKQEPKLEVSVNSVSTPK